MFEVLLYTAINCQEATDLIGRAKAHENMSQTVITEIVETLKESTPECNWDAND